MKLVEHKKCKLKSFIAIKHIFDGNISHIHAHTIEISCSINSDTERMIDYKTVESTIHKCLDKYENRYLNEMEEFKTSATIANTTLQIWRVVQQMGEKEIVMIKKFKNLLKRAVALVLLSSTIITGAVATDSLTSYAASDDNGIHGIDIIGLKAKTKGGYLDDGHWMYRSSMNCNWSIDNTDVAYIKGKATNRSSVYVEVKKIGEFNITATSVSNPNVSFTKTVNVSPARIYKLVSAKNKKKGAITVQWTPSGNADGYCIQYSTDKTFTKKVKSKYISKSKVKKSDKCYDGFTAKMLLFDITGLKKGKTYYVRIKAYSNANGKKYYTKKWVTYGKNNNGTFIKTPIKITK